MEARAQQVAVMHLVEASSGGEGMFGKERAIYALMRAQRAAGELRPRLAVFSPCELGAVAAADGFDVDVLGDAERTIPMNALRALRRALTSRERLVVHTHGYKANVIGRMLRLSGAPIAALVSTCHGFVSNTANLRAYNALDRFTGGLSDVVTAPDPGMLRRFGPGSRTAFVPNAVADAPAVSAQQRAAARAALGWNDGDFVAGMLGRLSQEKGVANFLDAARAVAVGGSPIVWAIAGSGPLEAAVRAAGISSLRYLGFLEDPRSFLAGLDVYVQPSFTEGLSISLLEAMRAGLPIAATPVGATGEAVRDGIEALLVPPEGRAIFEAVRSLQADKALRERLGAAARARFLASFRMESIERRYAALYREAIARHRTRGAAAARGVA